MDKQQLFIKMALGNWNLQISRLEKMFNSFTDEELQLEIAPGKNRVIYLLGHFVAYHDMLGESLGLTARKYEHLDDAFIKNADKAGFDMPDAAFLRQAWLDVHENLSNLFGELSGEDWFEKHMLVSDDDFAKDLTRNRLSMVMNRTAHAAYHAGQIKLCNN
jgi:hypothetical protein